MAHVVGVFVQDLIVRDLIVQAVKCKDSTMASCDGWDQLDVKLCLEFQAADHLFLNIISKPKERWDLERRGTKPSIC